MMSVQVQVETAPERKAQRRNQRNLIEGRLMRCPRCKEQHDILRFIPLLMVEEFIKDTTTIYKCPKCLWLFAPTDNVVLEALAKRNGHSA